MASSIYSSDTPDAVKNATGLHLLTTSTPNGQKVQIFLEELARAYSHFNFSFSLIDFSVNEQKRDWYLRINPNGRIPVLVDNTVSPPHPVMETSAELLYLQRAFDPQNHFGFADPREHSDMVQWLLFWHGSGAPYLGNFGYFSRATEQTPAAIDRFRKESLRVLGVLEIRLSGKYSGGEPRDYLAGSGKGKYSVADIGTWSWVKTVPQGMFAEEEVKELPHLVKWIDRIAAREAVKVGSGPKYNRT